MHGELVVALVVAIPAILFPAAFVWYMNFGGILDAIKEAKTGKTDPAPVE